MCLLAWVLVLCLSSWEEWQREGGQGASLRMSLLEARNAKEIPAFLLLASK